MRASDALVEKIKEFEGFLARPGKADKSEKYLTIGYGHYGKDVRPGMTITRDAATVLLRRDLAGVERYVTGLQVAGTQFEFDALADFAYNLGTGALGGSTLLKKVRERRAALNAAVKTAAHEDNAYEEAIRREFLRWVNCGGKRLPGLVKRRQWEADWFFRK